MDQKDASDQITAACGKRVLRSPDLASTEQNSPTREPAARTPSETKRISGVSGEPVRAEGRHSNGTWEPEAVVPLRSPGRDGPSTPSGSVEDDMSYEVQQAYKIFTGFLSDKHKGITGTFLQPIGHRDAQHGTEGARGQVHSLLRQSMCLRRIEEKFVSQQYESITEFVADFRLMLENCYRYYGVDHWVSKQGQKLEIMLEQKLTLLSRVLREKTSLAVTSKGRFGAEEERGSGGTSTRRRQASRYLATVSGAGHESVMVRTLRQEEQQRVKEEKRQRELEKKEAEEMSAKEVEEWEQNLLSQAAPHTVGTLWELPAIGHFLCLAQTALNLPEIVFFELERCLLMPRCSPLLSKVMSTLLSPPQRRATLQRRPALPYRRWESELRQRVAGWYRAVGASHNQPRHAEQLGLCHQFFGVLGEASPLEETPFHLLPFHQRVWLLKGLCDHVYETQKDVQDAVLAQPIHECRESILGYDSKENAYIHFPHFCGADLRIYRQSPGAPPAFPFPSLLVRRVDVKPATDGEASAEAKSEADPDDGRDGARMDTGEDFGSTSVGARVFKKENGDREEGKGVQSLSAMDVSQSESSDGDSCEDSKSDVKKQTNSSSGSLKAEASGVARSSKQERVFSFDSERAIKAEAAGLNVAEHSYTGRSAPSAVTPEEASRACGPQTPPRSDRLKADIRDAKSARLSPEAGRQPSEERADDKIWTKRKKRKKKRARDQPPGEEREEKRPQPADGWSPPPAEAAGAVAPKVATTIKRREKKKKDKTGKNPDSLKKIKEESPPAVSFKLVCSNLDELRELISKTEDELDELESMKKRLGRWYYKKEAVKELHSTLIRLLNELLPWEPKLVKAYQRNRLRLKKECDDFKKHPEYNNFVREECLSSSSSSSSSSSDDDEDDYEETDMEKIHRADLEEEDQEHVVPRGLWSGASNRESAADKAVTGAPADGTERGFTLLPGAHGVFHPVASADWRREATPGPVPQSPSGDPSWAAGVPPHSSASPVLNPTCKLPPGYTPIPTLLAKSVGNKVTLMRRPTHFPAASTAVSLPNSAVTDPKAQSFPSGGNQVSRQATAKAPLQTDALPKAPQGTPSQTEPQSPVQVVCKVSGGVGHLVKTDGSSQVRIPAHSVVDKTTVEKVMQQVLFLPSTHLIQKHEAKAAPGSPQHPNVLQGAASKAAAPVCMSTDVPGFSIPDGRIPVQQVAPLAEARRPGNPAPAGPPTLQPGAPNPVRLKGPQVCTVKASTVKGGPPGPSAEADRLTEPKQELKTVCIRDSQSILVTTRGGNTGIVKVQTSSEQNSLGSFPTSPVITISPQLKAFLVSKTSPPTASVAAQTSLALPAPGPAPSVTSSSQTRGLAGKTGAAAALSRFSGVSTAVTKISPPVNSPACSSPFPPSASKNPAVAPSPSSSGVSNEPAGRTGVKRSSTEEMSQFTKYILVTSSSNHPASKETPSSGSGVVAVGQPAATAAGAFMGASPKQMTGAGGGQALVAPLSGPAVKMGTSAAKPVACVSSEPLASGCPLQAGVALPLLGKSPTMGQTVVAPSHSPSKASPLPPSGAPTDAASAGPAPLTNLFTVTSCSPQLDARTSLPALSPTQAAPSTSVISQTSRPAAHTAATLLAENVNGKERRVPAAALSSSSAAQVTTRTGACTAQTRAAFLDQKPLHGKSATGESGAATCNTTSAPTAHSATSTCATGPVTQRIIINTSTHLTAGTQIVLNNACFVVPPQGLAPGSHVLIISNPAPQVPATSAEAVLPPKGTSPAATITPQAPGLSQSAARLPGMPAVSSPFVACTPALGQPLLPSTPHVAPFRLTGAPGAGSALIPSKTNVVSALPRLPPAHGCNFVLPSVCASALISSPPRLGSVPVLPSPVKTTTPSLGSALPTVRVTGGTGTKTIYSSAVTSAVSTSSPRLPEALSALPVLLSSSAGAFHSPVTPAPAAVSAASPITNTAALRGDSVQAGPGKVPTRTTGPFVHPVLSGARTQELPTVAVPPILSPAARSQALPVATVPPIGSTTISTFEAAPPASTALITPPVASPVTKSTVSPPVLSTNQALRANPVQTSASGLNANSPSKLLISTDGAVLSAVRCQVDQPGTTACPKPRDALVVPPNGSSGLLQTRDSTSQPRHGDAN
ncbi:uncharacterized protein KIAA2026 isoform X1 [Fundulus heteroclitus]|uniref:uncharacterized protein KIAA2026 isoform X1 n=1 Tax=Fundulus heteroclitus TaxID=8078 RepID=UPI00165BF7BB|nr:uncharacterized protein KIAA2026 isoform X1 [Fundulus heteroclitus]XP_021175457.2 uncharacterized protein KIAA2026 isoform X1 [Fundulus heteroclitus]